MSLHLAWGMSCFVMKAMVLMVVARHQISLPNNLLHTLSILNVSTDGNIPEGPQLHHQVPLMQSCKGIVAGTCAMRLGGW
jgi:hypothetical protein